MKYRYLYVFPTLISELACASGTGADEALAPAACEFGAELGY